MVSREEFDALSAEFQNMKNTVTSHSEDIKILKICLPQAMKVKDSG